MVDVNSLVFTGVELREGSMVLKFQKSEQTPVVSYGK